MGEVVGEIVGIHVIVMDVAPTVLTFRLQVEPNIVPVSGPHFVIWMLRVSKILWDGDGQTSCLKQGHLALKVFILASVVLND